MKLPFWKKEENTNGAFAPYEEIDTKKTSRLGYFFLILMVLFGVFQGNNLLGEIQNSIQAPEPNSTCLNQIASYAKYDLTNRYSYFYYPSSIEVDDCVFTEREIAAGLDSVYLEMDPLIKKTSVLSTEIQSLQNSLQKIQSTRSQSVQDYQASLNEDMRGDMPSGVDVFDSNEVGTTIRTQGQMIASMQSRLDQKQQELTRLENTLSNIATAHISDIKKVDAQHQSEIRSYKTKQFLLSLVLIFPLFLFAWHRRNLAQKNRSEYGVIWSGVVATFGIIAAQVLLTFIYDIIPHEIIARLMRFFSEVQILLTLLYWLGFILVPLFFGGLIYFIQKKLYNKQAVMMRALKSNHCPNCSLTINHTMNNCPICGYSLKTKCEHCGSMSLSGGSFCEVCGNRREHS